MNDTASATTTTSEAQVTQSDDDAAASSASEGIASTNNINRRRSNFGGSTSQPHTPTTRSPAAALSTIVDADVPYATVLYSSEGVMIRYVIRFVNDCGARWCVEKRYSDLLVLHEALREQYESTRSLGTKISSFISSGNGITSTPSAVASPASATASGNNRPPLASSSGRTPSSPPPSASSPITTVGAASPVVEDDNQRSSLKFPKFPGKALGKATNQSIPFIITRRRDLSHYFTALVRNGCRTFVRTGGAQRALCDFARPPPTVSSAAASSSGWLPPSGSGLLYGAAQNTQNTSESSYYFREDDDGFLSVEQKTYVYAYFSVASPLTGGAAKGGGGHATSGTAHLPGGGSSRECAAAAAWRKLAVTRLPENHRNPYHNHENDIQIVHTTGGGGGGVIASTGSKSSAGLAESHRSIKSSGVEDAGSGDDGAMRGGHSHCRRQLVLDRNACQGYIPTVTICLPYARIVHDLLDARRVVVALRCDRNEGRAEVMRRRDELVAFYRHIANGAVDRLPDVHEAKRFFVNYRRDNPLQEYGSVRLSASASSRDRLPATLPVVGASFSQKKLRRSPLDDDREQHADLSDVEDNVETDNEAGSEDEAMKSSIVVSLASLRQTTSTAAIGASGAGLATPMSMPEGRCGSSCWIAEQQQQLAVEPSSIHDAVIPAPTTSTVTAGTSSQPLQLSLSAQRPASTKSSRSSACSNSSHYVGLVVNNIGSTLSAPGAAAANATVSGASPMQVGGEATATSTVIRPVPECLCTEHTFCTVPTEGCNHQMSSHHPGVDGHEVAFVGYKASSGYQIQIYHPKTGAHTRRNRGSSPASSNTSRAQSRQ